MGDKQDYVGLFLEISRGVLDRLYEVLWVFTESRGNVSYVRQIMKRWFETWLVPGRTSNSVIHFGTCQP